MCIVQFCTIVHLTRPERACSARADEEVGRCLLVADHEVVRRCSRPTRTVAERDYRVDVGSYVKASMGALVTNDNAE